MTPFRTTLLAIAIKTFCASVAILALIGLFARLGFDDWGAPIAGVAIGLAALFGWEEIVAADKQ